MKFRLLSSRLVVPAVLLIVLAGATALFRLGLADASDSITVSHDGFQLTCPGLIAEGSTLTCTLTNTAATEEDWPVVGILHRSDDSNRALVRGSPLDVELSAPTPEATIEGGLWWIGSDLVGYSFFDWSGTAAAASSATTTTASATTTTISATTSSRQVVISILDDGDHESEEVFYVSLASDGSRNVGVLYNNRQKVRVSDSDSKSSDSSLSDLRIFAGGGVEEQSLTFSSAVLSYQVTVDYDVTDVTLIPTVAHGRATVAVNGVQAESGAESAAVHLASGSTSIAVLVTAEDGTSQTYTVAVSRGSRTENVEVGVDGFTLSCPSQVVEGNTLTCTLTNTNSDAAPWPVVAIIHSSADDNRALITEDSVIASTASSYAVDLEFAESQTPVREDYKYGYGELFSGGSMSVYTVYGYEKFDWSGEAAANTSRTVSIDIKSDDEYEDEDGEVFFVALTASDSTGLSGLVDNKAPVLIVDPPPTEPGAPTIASVAPGVQSLTVEWTAPDDSGGREVTSYDARYIETSADETVDTNWTVAQAWTSGDGDLSHTITGLDSGTQYDVEVRAVNSIGAGDWSATATGTPPTRPGAPTITSVAPGVNDLTVVWTAPADDGGAEVTSYDARYIATSADETMEANWAVEQAWTTGSGDLSHAITGLDSGTQYDVEVRASNAVGVGDWSADESATTSLSSDATLSALALTGSTLYPSFTSGTTSYKASTGHADGLVTVVATTSDDNASVAFLDGDGNSLTDADSAAGLQVGLSVGANVIKVQVTAEDGVTTKTYTIRVTRAAQDLSLSPPASDPAAVGQSAAVYTVTFRGRWTSNATPGGRPGGAHFSRLIGAVHNAGATFLESGGTAGAGVESMAETGGYSTLSSEVSQQINNADPPGALSVLSGSTDFIGPTATRTLSNVEVTTGHPRITLTTMIAPSPDWFVGVAGLLLLDAQDGWIESLAVNLYPWDAGTEDGAEFSLDNPATVLQGVITSISGTGRFSAERIATLTFTRESISPRFPATETGERTIAENTPPNRNIGAPVAAEDPDGGSLTYTLSGPGAGLFDIVASSGQLRTKGALDHEAASRHSVTVNVVDPYGLSASIAVTVTVADVNEAPAVSGPPRANFDENALTDVADYDATDPDNDTLVWSLSGADAAHFEVGAGGVLSFAEPPDFEARADTGRNNVYNVTVRATDRDLNDLSGLRDEVAVAVTVRNVNEPPMITSDAAPSYDENGTGGVATYRATDPENNMIGWSLLGPDRDVFTVNAAGVLEFDSPPDFEDPDDTGGDNDYNVTVVASDGAGLSDSIAVTVTVADVNEAPAVSGPPSANFDENALTDVADYDATDPDNDTLVWSLSGADAAHFEVSTSGVLSFAEPPDFEARADTGRNNVYNVTVRATDRDLNDLSGLRDEVAVAVTVRNVNEPPMITGDAAPSYDENGTGDVATYSATDPDGHMIGWSLAGPDRDVFTVSASGVLEFDSPPDFEDPDDTGGDNDYQVTVVASDGDRTSELAVTVTVGNKDEPGAVGLSSQPQAGTELTATLSDPDGSVSDASWSWQRSQNRSSWSEISTASARRYTPSEDDVGLYLRASVSYDDGEGAAKSAEQASDARTRAEPPTNTVPEFSGGDAQRTVAENSPAGTAVGAPVAASDPDAGDTLIYTLTGGEGLFRIDRTSGQIRVDGGAMLDHEVQSSYEVTVTATDTSTASDSVLVDITVTDVDEPPEAADDRATLSEDTPARIDVLDNDTDPDGEDLSVVLRDRPDNGTAAVEADNTVTYTPDADYHGIDTFTYRASDGRYFDEATVTVVVEPVNDAPAFGSTGDAQRTVAENSPAGTAVGAPVAADDADAGDTLIYTLTGGEGLFRIDRAGGQVRVDDGAVLDHEDRSSYEVTVTATDTSTASDSVLVDITVTDVDEPPEAADDRATLSEDIPARIDVLANDTDPDGEDLSIVLRDRPDNGTAAVEADNTVTYTPDADYHGIDTFTYRASDGRHFDEATVTVIVEPVNDAPAFGSTAGAERTVATGAAAGTPVGAPVAADDADGDILTYTLSGTGAALFDIDQYSAQVIVSADAALDAAAATHRVTVTAADPANATASIEVTITTTSNSAGGGVGDGGGGGGGGGGPPEPSEPPEPPELLDGSDMFGDVEDGAYYEAAVAWMFQQQITVGCASEPLRYCPGEPVTRAQMASFLTRALELEAPAQRAGFADVEPSGVHADAIEALYGARITVGCASEPLRYCPGEPVTRAQMAAFLTRALDLEAPAQRAGFADVEPSGVHADAMEALYGARITVGCASEPLRYCPDRPVTRAQMAAFLYRARDLIAAAAGSNTNEPS